MKNIIEGFEKAARRFNLSGLTAKATKKVTKMPSSFKAPKPKVNTSSPQQLSSYTKNVNLRGSNASRLSQQGLRYADM